jgi:hypothetical protein
MPSRALLIAAALLLPWLGLLQPSAGMCHDIAWFYYVARGVLRGGKLYRDYIEPNAPLASLTLIPVVWLNAALHVAPAWGVRIYFTGVCSLVLVLCVAMLRALRLSGTQQLWGLVSLTVVCVFLPKANFGQREHLLFMLLVPYTLAAAAACRGAAPGCALGAAAGALAAMAVFIKPPFLLVPALLEIFVVVRTRRLTWRRSEVWTFAAVMAALIAVTAVFFPLYAATVVPWAVALYGGYDKPGNVVAYTAVYGGLALAGWFACKPGVNSTLRTLRDVVMVAFAGALLAFVAQGKGWFYQAYPASAFAALLVAGAVGSAFMLRPLAHAADAARGLAGGISALLALLYMVYGATTVAERTLDPAVVAEIARAPGPFVVFSASVDPGFPLALTEDRVWASRYPCLIMLPGILKAERNGGVSRWEAPFRATLVADLVRYRPSVVVVSEAGGQALPDDFSVLAWLKQDPAFVGQIGNYRDEGSKGGYRVFARK